MSSFDETKLNSRLYSGYKYGKLFGAHKCIKIVIARGVKSKLKEPIYFDVDKQMKKNTLFDITIQCIVKAST